MKKSMFFAALVVPLATASGYGQSVEEMLGLTASAVQAPEPPTGTGHATAEEAPFYVRFTIQPVIQGSINTNPSSVDAGTRFYDSKVEFDLGIGVGLALGWRIPETYVFLELATGFQWAGVKNFQGTYDPASTGTIYDLESSEGNLYQVPILFTPGLEFELPGGWPFLAGGAIRFGPSVGVMYHDLTVNNINSTAGNDIFTFGSTNWIFAYGATIELDLFLSHNVALTLGYQFVATTGANYGDLAIVGSNADAISSADLPDVKSNFTYTNIINIGVSIFF